MPTDPVISVKGLLKRYGERIAVHDVDLEVARGEVFALLGPNGAGKTTTVEILEGHRCPTAGWARVLGVDPVKGDARWRARLGMVVQSSHLTDELTVEEVVGHFATYYPSPRSPDEVIELVGLTEQRHQRLRSLSGGQQRRVEVALGMVGRPELLFLDEPTTGFDPEARRRFWDLIDALASEGTTIVLTTHYLEEAERLADRVGVIVAGRIVAIGPPATLAGRHRAASVVRWREAGRTVEHATDRPTAFVLELSSRLGGEIPGLTIARPTLEDVYLEMIGAAA